MDTKNLEKLEEKLEGIDELLSHQNILVGEIKEILTKIERFPLYVGGGILFWVVVEKLWDFFFGY